MLNPFTAVDKFLNKTTMYRLVLYILSVYAAAGLLLSALGILSLSFGSMLLSLVIVLGVGFAANQLFAKLYHAPWNFESGMITTLILFCILPPATSLTRALAIGLVVAIAMASKYVLAWQYKHIFNPAAVAVVIVGLVGLLHATWWIGTPNMLPFTIIGGLLIVRKLRRFSMVVTFLFTALIVMLLTDPANQEFTTILRNAFLSWPLIFFGTIMLTEPSTTPPTRYYQILYAVLVGTLFSSRLDLGPLHTTPEVSLLLGNIFAYAVSPKYNLILKFKEKILLSPNVYEFVFTPNRKLVYKAGQYMEWTLPSKTVDSRGNRRTFTIASSPTENDIRLGVKFYEPSSQFKQQLQSLKPKQAMMAGHITGDFVLPANKSQKLVFIAGGIGITPFRSMIKYLADTGQRRDIVLFYAINNPADAAYQDVLKKAQSITGIKICFLIATGVASKNLPGYQGVLTQEILQKEAPDFTERMFYISGPPPLVNAYKKLLQRVGLARTHIKTDYFAGY